MPDSNKPRALIFSASGLVILTAIGIVVFFNWYMLLTVVDRAPINEALMTYYQADGNKEEYQLVSIKPNTQAAGDRWAILHCTIETKLKDGTCDVAWNTVTISKDSGTWHVTSTAPAAPEPEGAGKITGETHQEIFVAFTQNPDIKYLAGPARLTFVQYPLDKKKYQQMQINLQALSAHNIFQQDKVSVDHYQYQVNGKDVACDVTYYETAQGWKIVAVNTEH